MRRAAVASLAGLYALLFLIVSKARLDRFAFRDQDLALHAQSFWAVLHGTTRISILGISFLANHLHAFSFLLAPFYLICPNAYFPLVVQTLALAAGAFPLYRIAARRAGSGIGLSIVASYLLYPALGYVNFSEFHMPSLVVPLLLWAHDAYETDRRNRLVALLVAVALVQENFPLFGAIYGVLLVAKRRDWVRGTLLTAGCLLYLYAGFELIMPALRRSGIAWERLPTPKAVGYYDHIGRSLSEILRNVARDPLGIAETLGGRRKAIWLAQLFLPLALLPLAGAEWLIPAVPYFLQHLLSARANETSIRSHYAAEMIPFLFIATVVGIDRVRRRLPRRIGPPLVAALLLASVTVGNAILGCQFFLVKDALHIKEVPPDPLRTRLVAMVPPEAATVASFDVLSRLVNRRFLHTLDHIARGTYTVSNRVYRLPIDTRYALIDWTDDIAFRTYDSGELDRNVARAFADGTWRVIVAEGPVTLLHHEGVAAADTSGAFVMPPRPFAGQPQLFQIVSMPPPGFRGPKLLFDGTLELLDASVISAPPEEPGRVRVGLVWRGRAPSPGQYLVTLEVVGRTGRVHAATDHPICYNIYPPTRWAAGEMVREDVWIPVTAPLVAGDYGLSVRADGYRAARPVATEKLSEDVVMMGARAIVCAWRAP